MDSIAIVIHEERSQLGFLGGNRRTFLLLRLQYSLRGDDLQGVQVSSERSRQIEIPSGFRSISPLAA